MRAGNPKTELAKLPLETEQKKKSVPWPVELLNLARNHSRQIPQKRGQQRGFPTAGALWVVAR